MFSALNEAVNKLMDGFFQQQEENRRLHKRCDELQEELRDMQAKQVTQHEEFERRIEAASKSFENLTFDHVLVGFCQDIDVEIPIFIMKDSGSNLFERCITCANHEIKNVSVNLESFQYFDKILDYAEWSKLPSPLFFYKENYYEVFSDHPIEYIMSCRNNLKDLYKACKELGIKFVINGSDSFNGVPIDKILS